MTATAHAEAVPGRHVCWIVAEGEDYTATARAMLDEGVAAGQKTVAFGPKGSPCLSELASAAVLTADPRVDFLGGGPLEPETMFAMFREQSARARDEGYEGLHLVADMDWLLPAGPTTDDVVAFELLLDRVVHEVGATVVCAYRRSSFDTAAVTGALAVHPVASGTDEEPPFHLVADGAGGWRLSGEVDVAALPAFEAAFGAATSACTPCEVDVAGIEFIDVAGMRVIAQAGVAPNVRLRLRGASPRLRRSWSLARFDDAAPAIELVDA